MVCSETPPSDFQWSGASNAILYLKLEYIFFTESKCSMYSRSVPSFFSSFKDFSKISAELALSFLS